MGAYPGQETGRGQDQGKRVQGGMEVGVKEVGAGIDMGGWRDRDEQARNMEEQVQKAKEMGVEMAKYFKPDAVNPLSYAEQVQKRKLIWSKQ